MNSIKYVTFALLLMVCLSVALPAFASVCKNYNHHQICILSINRSAKNYWEYRAAVSVDGLKTPIEVYNCRQRFKIQQNGAILSFEQKSPGEMICSFFNSSGQQTRAR